MFLDFDGVFLFAESAAFTHGERLKDKGKSVESNNEPPQRQFGRGHGAALETPVFGNAYPTGRTRAIHRRHPRRVRLRKPVDTVAVFRAIPKQ